MILAMTAQPAEQLIFDLGHRTAQGREDFLVAPSNRDAVAWIDRWPSWPAPALVIYGPPACGKSHLAAVWRDRAGAALLDPQDICKSPAADLLARGPHLVIDSADGLIGDREKETALFHLYNRAREQGQSLLLTFTASPAALGFVLPDLASRLRAAPAVAVQPPDDTLLGAVLVKMFADRQIVPGADVLTYILPRMERSFAAARDLVSAADRLALAEKKPVSVALARRLLNA